MSKTTHAYSNATAMAALVLICAVQSAFADDTGQPADERLYTLFDPVPDSQMRDMDTDRPNTTNTPHTIDAGHLQIETGLFDYTDTRDHSQGGDARTDLLTLGHLNVRLGVLNNLEVNATLDSYGTLRSSDHITGQTTHVHGLGDIGIGVKLNLWGDDGRGETWSTALAVQPQVSIPTAGRGLGTGYSQFSIGLPLQIILPADFHLGLQTVVSRQRNAANTGYVTGFQNSASIDRAFWNFDIYLEYASRLSTDDHGYAQNTMDAGFTYPLTPNLVLDAGANFGLDRDIRTVEFLAGASIRF